MWKYRVLLGSLMVLLLSLMGNCLIIWSGTWQMHIYLWDAKLLTCHSIRRYLIFFINKIFLITTSRLEWNYTGYSAYWFSLRCTYLNFLCHMIVKLCYLPYVVCFYVTTWKTFPVCIYFLVLYWSVHMQLFFKSRSSLTMVLPLTGYLCVFRTWTCTYCNVLQVGDFFVLLIFWTVRVNRACSGTFWDHFRL